MNGAMIHYYFYKDVLDKLDNEIKEKMDFNESLLFNYANFNSSPTFFKLFNFFKIDKYGMQNNFDGVNFNNFIVDCAVVLNKENKFNQLQFLYGMMAYRILNDYLYPFINTLKSNDYSFNIALNMIDFYFAKRNGFDVTKESIYEKFPDSFIYYDYMDELIRFPLVKNFKLMSSESYFKRCYKKKKKFYKRFAKVKYKAFLLSFYSLFYRRRKILPKEFPYRKKIDTNLLNVKKAYFKIGEFEYNYTIDELVNKALKDAVNKIKALNSYLFDNNENKFRKEFNISEEKKI